MTQPHAYGADSEYKVSSDLMSRERLGSEALARGFLARLLTKYFPKSSPQSIRILDVGCGLGYAVRILRGLGYDAYGLEPGGRYEDIPENLRAFVWRCYSHELPERHPEAGRFDFIMSHGVIEHVGTHDGHADLVDDFQSYRREFMESQIALLKPGGLLLTCGPNRLFFFDFQHGPHDYGWLTPLKRVVPPLNRLTLPWHAKNYLASYRDIEMLVGEDIECLHEPQRDYLSLSSLKNSPLLRKIFSLYIGAASVPPFSIRKYFETHTIFLCRLSAAPDLSE